MLRTGIIGCGNISGIYLDNLTKRFARDLKITAVCDLNPERASEAAGKAGADALSYADVLMARDDVDAVLNLTTPLFHRDVTLAALKAGKHVYSEKPLGVTFEEGQTIAAQAAACGLRVGCAPDTFLGAGIQTALKIIEDGWIGKVTGAHAFMLCGGHEGWHPAPAFYYARGGGPMFDMGPYYLTALLALMGPAVRVAGMSGRMADSRIIGSEPLRGTAMPVEVDTHVNGLISFASGATASVTTTFDVPVPPDYPRIAIYGSEGTLLVPDPNTFGGPVRVRTRRTETWTEFPLIAGFPENSRGLGLADMARGIVEKRPHAASLEASLHVLEMMEGFTVSQQKGCYVDLTTTVSHSLKLSEGAI